MNQAHEPGPRLLGQAEFDMATLWRRYPPRLVHPHKRLVLEAAGGSERTPSGTLSVARYAPGGLPARLRHRQPESRGEEAAFDYPAPEAGATHWHVNFADPRLFFAYGSALFAQDEMQVAEHPVLGSLLEALIAEPRPGLEPHTIEPSMPTPILIRGAERWCAIDTTPDLAMPHGIYGRRFAKATPPMLRQAVSRLELAHRTNLIAMAAPTGAGRYTREEIELILLTAFTGFAAARGESPAADRVIVHTGHWGTGAFGGNRVLMALAQLLAARLAAIDVIVYHSVGGDGAEAFAEATRLAAGLGDSPLVADVVKSIDERGFMWGRSDGN